MFRTPSSSKILIEWNYRHASSRLVPNLPRKKAVFNTFVFGSDFVYNLIKLPNGQDVGGGESISIIADWTRCTDTVNEITRYCYVLQHFFISWVTLQLVAALELEPRVKKDMSAKPPALETSQFQSTD